jgi:hypothetical protein
MFKDNLYNKDPIVFYSSTALTQPNHLEHDVSLLPLLFNFRAL